MYETLTWYTILVHNAFRPMTADGPVSQCRNRFVCATDRKSAMAEAIWSEAHSYPGTDLGEEVTVLAVYEGRQRNIREDD